MAVSSNRSPSPLSTRSNSNPRTSEIHTNQPARRSFSGSSPFARPSLVTNPRRFNPVTPANSPADYGRRQSVGKGGGVVGSSWGCEEKENEKDQSSKAMKLRSPAKGSKNFMSPTISAASKFTPSPRKKVLVERNELVRTSITLLDGKATFFSNSSHATEDLDAKSDVCMVQKHQTEAGDASEEPLVCKPVKKVTFREVPFDAHDSIESLVEEVSAATLDSVNIESNSKNKPYCSSVESLSNTVDMVSDCVNVDEPNSKNKPYCSSVESLSDTVCMSSDCVNDNPCSREKPPCPSNLSPIIAPLDADPSFPPYDPKTNYLSPRPQFLHYKPNPRVELLLNKENGLDFEGTKQLEDSFMCELSENFSDSEGTEESQTGDLQKEPDGTSSVEMVVPDVDEPQISESLPVSTQLADEISGEIFETRRPSRPCFITRWKSLSMLLVCLIACVSISVTDSPVTDSSVLKNVNFIKFYEPSEVATLAKVNFAGVTRKLKQWSADSLSYLLKLIPAVDEADKLGPLQFINLTDVPDDSLQFFEIDRGSKAFLENLAPDEEEEEEVHDELGSSKEQLEEEIETLEDHSEAEIDDGNEKYLETLNSMEIAEVPAAPALVAEIREPESSLNVDNQEQTDYATKSEAEYTMESLVSVPQAFDIKVEEDGSEIENLRSDNDFESSVRVESSKMDINQESSSGVHHYIEDNQIPDVLESSVGKPGDNITYLIVLGISLLPLALVSAAVLLYRKQRKMTAPVVRDIDSSFQKKMMSVCGSDHFQQEKPSYSQNRPTEVDDVLGESCPDEMSSFNRSSYYCRDAMKGSEAHSYETKSRRSSKRESLASSSSEYSMATPSYGSFTTYERIPIKHASGDEEIVTPVRRSSRLHRNQVTSP